MPRFDLDFIEALKSDDEKAYERVRIFSYKHALLYIKNREDAEDIASDAVISIRNSIKKYKPSKGKGTIENNFKGWVKKIVLNAYLDLREQKKRDATFEMLSGALNLGDDEREALENGSRQIDERLSLEVYAGYPFKNNPEWSLAARDVIEATKKLKTPKKRIAILLKYLYNFKTHEIANLMGENFDAIQTVIHRTRAEMLAIYKEHGIDADYLAPESWRIKHLLH
jgi:RNA polymerase sigma factor (sigma-70 family)